MKRKWRGFLTVFVGREGPRVDVDVGVDFDRGDRDAAALEDRAERAGDDAFADARNHAARYQHVLHGGRHFGCRATGGDEQASARVRGRRTTVDLSRVDCSLPFRHAALYLSSWEIGKNGNFDRTGLSLEILGLSRE